MAEELAAIRAALSTDDPVLPAFAARLLLNEIDAIAGQWVSPHDGACVCANILRDDDSRHFKECPLRAKWPEPRGSK